MPLLAELRRLERTCRPDAILVSAPPFSSFLAVALFAAKARIPWVAEFRDRWADDPYALIPNWRRAADRRIENWAVGRAAGIVTVPKPWSEHYARVYQLPVCTAMNGFDPHDFTGLNPVHPPGRLPLSIVYIGFVYPERRDPTALFEALEASELAAGDVRIFCYGSRSDYLETCIDQVGVRRFVQVEDPVPYAEALRLQSMADVLLLLQWDDPADEGNIPGKIFEYLASLRRSRARQLVTARDHSSLDHGRVDEAGYVTAELGQPLSRGAFRIFRQRVGHQLGVEGRVHNPRRCLPNEDMRALAAKMLAVLVPYEPLAAVRAARPDQDAGGRQGGERRLQGADDLLRRIGRSLGTPKCRLVEQRRHERSTAHAAIAADVDLDSHLQPAKLDPVRILRVLALIAVYLACFVSWTHRAWPPARSGVIMLAGNRHEPGRRVAVLLPRPDRREPDAGAAGDGSRRVHRGSTVRSRNLPRFKVAFQR